MRTRKDKSYPESSYIRKIVVCYIIENDKVNKTLKVHVQDWNGNKTFHDIHYTAIMNYHDILNIKLYLNNYPNYKDQFKLINVIL